MKSNSLLSCRMLAVAAVVVLLGCQVESSSLVKSPMSSDLGGFLSMLLGFESDQSELKYDKKNHEWVEECPDIDCLHGTDEGDSETCPSCLLGPGESCGDWQGKCGEDLACRYESAYSPSGKCISEIEFNSRKAGENCGNWEGKCMDGLKCQVDPDPWMYFCGIEEPGVCVTEDQFSSRKEGETCGDSAGECQEGLECVQSDYCWFTTECRNLTKEESTPKHHQHVISIEEVIHSSNAEDDQPDQHITIELVSDEDDADEEKLIEEIFESEFVHPILGEEMKEEAEMIEGIIHSVMTKTNETEREVSSKKTTKTIENADKNEIKTIVVDIGCNDSDFAPLVFDAQSDPNKDDKNPSQPSVELL